LADHLTAGGAVARVTGAGAEVGAARRAGLAAGLLAHLTLQREKDLIGRQTIQETSSMMKFFTIQVWNNQNKEELKAEEVQLLKEFQLLIEVSFNPTCSRKLNSFANRPNIQIS